MKFSMPGFPSFTISLSLLKLMSIESVKPSNHLILCQPLLLLPSIFPSIRVFSNELALHFRWPKYWSFNFSISPSVNIPFRIDWFDLLVVQGDLLCWIIFMLQFSLRSSLFFLLLKLAMLYYRVFEQQCPWSLGVIFLENLPWTLLWMCYQHRALDENFLEILFTPHSHVCILSLPKVDTQVFVVSLID